MGVVAPGSTPRWQLYAGMPCWIELVTTDPDRACEFYAGLFGWSYHVHDDPNVDQHVIAYHEGFPVASIRTASGSKSAWRLYLATADREEAVRRAESHGAKVSGRSSELPGVGAKVMLMSPDDSEFGLLAPEDDWQFDVGLPGTLMWAELVTIKAQSADMFFSALFDYEFEQFGGETRGDYSVWYLGEDSVLARVNMVREFINEHTRPHWLLYLGVPPEVGTDDLTGRAIELGGRVRVDPYDATLGRVSVLRDPTGARFALVDSRQAPGDYASGANYDPYDD